MSFLADYSVGTSHQKHTGELWRWNPDEQWSNRISAEGDWGSREDPGEVHQWMSPPGYVPDISWEWAGEVQEDHRERG